MKPHLIAPKTKSEKIRIEKVSNQNDLPFIVAFRDSLSKKYNFIEMSVADIKTFQQFLDKIANMTFAQVNKRYRRKTDRTDSYNEEHVAHYAVTQKFRMHGVLERNVLYVIRLDPSHMFHG